MDQKLKLPRRGDLTDRQFGFLKVIKRAPNYITSGGNSLVQWECECACGCRKVVKAQHLRDGHVQSCGQCGLMGPSHELDDLVGREFGFLTVVSRAENHVSSGGNSFVAWNCRCDCGNMIVVTSGHLKTFHTRSCGKCGKYDHSRDFTGEHIGRLTVIEKSDEWYTYPDGSRDFKWVCRCDCGNITVTRGNVLRDTRFVQSCGCWRREESVKDEDMLDRDFGYCHIVSRASRINVGGPNGNSTVDAWNCVCTKCGRKFVARGPQIRFGKVNSCGCMSISVSKWETWLSQFLDEHGLMYEIQKSYSDLIGVGGKRLSYDFCINASGESILVECQGLQHYEPVEYFGGEEAFERQIEHDKRKKDYAIQHDISLITLDCSKDMSCDEYFGILNRVFGQYI